MIEKCMVLQHLGHNVPDRVWHVSPNLVLNNGERQTDIMIIKGHFDGWEDDAYRALDHTMLRYCTCGHDYLYRARHEFKDHKGCHDEP